MKPEHEIWIVQHLPYPLDRLVILTVRLFKSISGDMWFRLWGQSFVVSLIVVVIYMFNWWAQMLVPRCVMWVVWLILVVDLMALLWGCLILLRNYVWDPIAASWQDVQQDYPVQKKKGADDE